jgi:hypothetical protein
MDTIGPKTDARSREVLSSLIRHLHDFAREVELSVDEWMMGTTSSTPLARSAPKYEMKGKEFLTSLTSNRMYPHVLQDYTKG